MFPNEESQKITYNPAPTCESWSIPSDSKTNQGNSTDEFLTTGQVAKMINISRAGLYDLVARGEIAFYRFGRLLRYRQVDIDAFLEARRVERNPKFPRYGRYPTFR